MSEKELGVRKTRINSPRGIYIYIYIYYDLYCRKPDLYDLGMKLFIKFHFARCEHSAFAIYQGDHIVGESFNIVQSS